MNPMVITVGVALVLLIGGLVIIWLSEKALKPGLAATIVWWIGAAIATLGALLVLTPVLVWITHQFSDALGLGRTL